MTIRRLSHKFRFQLLHAWLINTYPPCRALDIGGGNGLLAYLLNSTAWQTTVIDPSPNRLVEWKFKDLSSGKQVKLTPEQRTSVTHIEEKFTPEMSAGSQLLIGLHAHGSNMAIIQSAAKYGLDFAILPCCVIDEPIQKRPGVNWLDSLFEYAQDLGLKPQKHTLSFVGQDTIIYTQNHLVKSLSEAT